MSGHVEVLRRMLEDAEFRAENARHSDSVFGMDDDTTVRFEREEAALRYALEAVADAERLAFFFDCDRAPCLGLGAMLMDNAKYSLDDWRGAIDRAIAARKESGE